MSKLSYDGLKTFKEKNDETYMGKENVLSVLDLEEETSVNDDDIIIKGQPETGDLVRIKASDFFSKVEDEIGDINSALAELPEIQTGSVMVSISQTGANESVNVTFNSAFSKSPRVCVSPRSSYPSQVYASVASDGATTTGFTLYYGRSSGSSNFNITWIAIAT